MIHGNKAQYDRTVTINQFKQGKYLILVATDLASEDSKSASMILRNFELSGQVITPKLEKLAISDSSFKNKRMKIGIGKYNITVNINKKS